MCQGVDVNVVFMLAVYLPVPVMGFAAGISLAYLSSIACTTGIHQVIAPRD